MALIPALCVSTSDCNNSGSNDCANGSNCANTGQGTTVIAIHADCSSGQDGTTKVCFAGGKSLTSGNANCISPIGQQSDSIATRSISLGGAMSPNNSPGLSSSTQNLVGNQLFGLNQHIAVSNDADASQTASSQLQNTDTNTDAYSICRQVISL